MNSLGFSRYTLSISVVAALLAACGGSQPPIGPPGTTRQSSMFGALRNVQPTWSYKVLYRFGRNGKEGRRTPGGSQPEAPLLDVNGTLYGTTERGGSGCRGGCGTVFRMSMTGAKKVLYRFRGGTDGALPVAGLIDVHGTLYGTTLEGGSKCRAGCGTVYGISTTGREKVLYSFAGGSDGALPEVPLINVNGTLYGTTELGGGGTHCTPTRVGGCGTVFSVSTTGAEKVVHSFGSGGSSTDDGAFPESPLIDVDGMLYGTTEKGGSYGSGSFTCGTVYSVSTSGSEKVLYNFKCGSDGWWPVAGLIDVNGTLYGTTLLGGDSSGCYGGSCGTVYSISTTGMEHVLYSFQGGSDGKNPQAGLLDAKNSLYGTTFSGGSGCGGGCGTVFTMSTTGEKTILHAFTGEPDGAWPAADLISVRGSVYGITSEGGNSTCVSDRENGLGCGTVFELSR